MQDKRKAFDLEERLIEFGLVTCSISEDLPANRLGDHIADQLIRSGTSPASNYGEAQSAESRRDFIHKLRVCLKELRESRVWMKFIEHKSTNPTDLLQSGLEECDELIAILTKSVLTAEKNSRGQTTRYQK